MFKDGDIVKGSSPTLFLIDGQRRRWISDPRSLLFLSPRGWAAVREVADEEIQRLPEGRPLTSFLDALNSPPPIGSTEANQRQNRRRPRR